MISAAVDDRIFRSYWSYHIQDTD